MGDDMVGPAGDRLCRVLVEDWLGAWVGCPVGWDSVFEVEARMKAPSIVASANSPRFYCTHLLHALALTTQSTASRLL